MIPFSDHHRLKILPSPFSGLTIFYSRRRLQPPVAQRGHTAPASNLRAAILVPPLPSLWERGLGGEGSPYRHRVNLPAHRHPRRENPADFARAAPPHLIPAIRPT